MSKSINALALQKAFLAGAQCIESKKDYINELNVFPVPDGDTGTNMSLTIMSAAREVGSIEEPTISTIAKAISSGSLRGARGNSGVILSQLFRGFCKSVADKEELNTVDVAVACQRAVETAYKAVMKPKEGTILTVAKGVSDKANEIARRYPDIQEFVGIVITYGNEVLAKTPDLLPVLKEAGVVDSGGQGLMEVLQGAYDSLLGKEVDYSNVIISPVKKRESVSSEDIDTSDIKFGYCTEFIVMIEKEYNHKTEAEFKEYLSSIGDSLVVVSDDDIVKVHVHTNHPGLAFERGLTYGSLTKMKIDNMREEHEEKLIKEASKIAAEQAAKKQEEPRKETGFIAVSIGEGINEIFTELGVDFLIEGGQTMNPSTEDMLNAIEQVNADTIYILPNNKNIVLAANQAKSLVEDKKIIVIPSKTVPQGISAIISFDPSKTPEDNELSMTEDMKAVKTGQVTYAVRDTSIDGKVINLGDIMGIGDEGIETVGKDVSKVTTELIEALADEDSELICIYYGEDVNEDDANALLDLVTSDYPQCDVELHYGGQPIYYYVVSIE